MMDTSSKKKRKKKTNPYVNIVVLRPHPSDPSDMHHIHVFNLMYIISWWSLSPSKKNCLLLCQTWVVSTICYKKNFYLVNYGILSYLYMCHYVTHRKQEVVPVNKNHLANYLSIERQQEKKGNTIKQQQHLNCPSFEPRRRKSRQQCLHFRLTAAWTRSVPDCSPICMTKSALFGSLSSFKRL